VISDDDDDDDDMRTDAVIVEGIHHCNAIEYQYTIKPILIFFDRFF